VHQSRSKFSDTTPSHIREHKENPHANQLKNDGIFIARQQFLGVALQFSANVGLYSG